MMADGGSNMANDRDRDIILRMRPTPGYVPQTRYRQELAGKAGDILRLQPRAGAGTLPAAPRRSSPDCFRAQPVALQQASFTLPPQRLTCCDGFTTVLGGERHVFLTGTGRGCEELLGMLALHALADDGSVLFLTGDRGERGGCCAVLKQVCDRCGLPLRGVGEQEAGRFLPFANWTQQQMLSFFSQRVAGAYAGQGAAPEADMTGCLMDLFELLEADPAFGECLADPRFSYETALERCGQADMPEPERSRLCHHMMNHTDTLMKAQAMLREFIVAFGGGTSCPGGQAYSIFSPGVNRVTLDGQSAMSRGSQPWFLMQMVGCINSLTAAHPRITVLVDRLSPDILQSVMSLISNSDVRIIMVAGSVMELGDQAAAASILSRSGQVFIFRQQDRSAAEYWSALSGDRKVLVRSSNTGTSVSTQPWHFATRGASTGHGYTEAFRPKIPAGEFAALRDDQAYLYMPDGRSGEAFHPFAISAEATRDAAERRESG